MKILIDLTSLYYHITGIERYAMELTGAMLSGRQDFSYILVFQNEIHESFIKYRDCGNVEIVIIKGSNRIITGQIKLPLALHKHKADAYLFPAFPCPVLFGKANTYVAIHDMSPWDCGADMKMLSRVYFKMADRHSFRVAKKIITVSRFSMTRIEALSGRKGSDIWLVYDGVSAFEKSDTDIFKKYGLPQNYILSLATLEPRKNLKLLLRAYKELSENSDKLPKLVLAGRSGWKIAEALGQDSVAAMKNVIFTGYIDEKDMAAVYQNATFFVFPSKYEGFGLPPLEAMSMGVPVLASDAASLPEVLGDAAIYFSNDDVEDLKAKLLQISGLDDCERNEMAEAGYKNARRFSWAEEAYKLSKKIETCGVKVRL